MTFAASPDAQAQAVEHAVEQARRVAARGADAVVIVDSLEYLSPAAARRALGAARNIADGGSLTVIAAAPAPLGGETTVIALDGALTAMGRFPALDLAASRHDAAGAAGGRRGRRGDRQGARGHRRGLSRGGAGTPLGADRRGGDDPAVAEAVDVLRARAVKPVGEGRRSSSMTSPAPDTSPAPPSRFLPAGQPIPRVLDTAESRSENSVAWTCPGRGGAQIACEITRQPAGSPAGISCARASAIVDDSKLTPVSSTRPFVDCSTAPPAPRRRLPAGQRRARGRVGVRARDEATDGHPLAAGDRVGAHGVGLHVPLAQ